MNNKNLFVLLHSILFLSLFQSGSSSMSYCSYEDNINCLRTLKDSLEDPFNYLNSSWNFNNNTKGFVCSFIGIDCWNLDESRVLNIRLSGMGLKGQFPKGLQNCSSLTGLDLSDNQLTGSIPSDIPKSLPYLTSLDLSSNNFSGEIPSSLSNCTYLNVLKLDNNRLIGQIPLLLGYQLNRLKTFNVSNNLLSGQIPTFGTNTNFDAECYANNVGLCGKPLKDCEVPRSNSEEIISHTALIIGFPVGFVAGGVKFKFLEKVFKKKKYSIRR